MGTTLFLAHVVLCLTYCDTKLPCNPSTVDHKRCRPPLLQVQKPNELISPLPVYKKKSHLDEADRDVPQVLELLDVQLGTVMLPPHAQQLRHAPFHELTQRLG